MSDLKRGLSESVAAAFVSAGLPAEFGRVTASYRPDLADFQCNGAIAAAKTARRDPREIAPGAVEALRADPRFASVETAGLGFINLRVSADTLSERANEIAADARLARSDGISRASRAASLSDWSNTNRSFIMYSACSGVVLSIRSAVLALGSAPSNIAKNGCFLIRCCIR